MKKEQKKRAAILKREIADLRKELSYRIKERAQLKHQICEASEGAAEIMNICAAFIKYLSKDKNDTITIKRSELSELIEKSTLSITNDDENIYITVVDKEA